MYYILLFHSSREASAQHYFHHENKLQRRNYVRTLFLTAGANLPNFHKAKVPHSTQKARQNTSNAHMHAKGLYGLLPSTPPKNASAKLHIRKTEQYTHDDGYYPHPEKKHGPPYRVTKRIHVQDFFPRFLPQVPNTSRMRYHRTSFFSFTSSEPSPAFLTTTPGHDLSKNTYSPRG